MEPAANHAHAPTDARKLGLALDQAIDALTATRKVLGQALIRATSDVDDGLSGASLAERVGGTSITDRATAERALALAETPDRVRSTASKMVRAIDASRAMAVLAQRSANFLLPIAHDRAEALAAEIDGAPAICANPHCRALVWRTPTDRLKSGRCTACYFYRRRHEGEERPRELVEAAL